MKTTIKIILLLAAMTFAMNKGQIYTEKGFGKMENKERIRPELFQYGKNFSSVLNCNRTNCFFIVGDEIEMNELIEIDKLKMKESFPGLPGNIYYTDNQEFIWSKNGRGFYSLEISSKNKKHIIISHDGDSEIRQSFLIDPKRCLFYIEQLTIGMSYDRSYSKYYVYNFQKDSIDFESGKFNGNHYHYDNDHLLSIEFYERIKVRWFLTDLKMERKIENNFTKKLTELQIMLDVNENAYDLKKHFLIGISKIENPITKLNDFYVIRWDSSMDDINAAPLTIQIPNGYFLTGSCNISPDGAWLKTVFTPKSEGKAVTVFYNLNDKYPQGLSLPVFGGNTVLENPGCFVNHTKFGPLYVEMDSDHENVLLIYRLNDCFEILRKKAVGK